MQCVTLDRSAGQQLQTRPAHVPQMALLKCIFFDCITSGTTMLTSCQGHQKTSLSSPTISHSTLMSVVGCMACTASPWLQRKHSTAGA